MMLDATSFGLRDEARAVESGRRDGASSEGARTADIAATRRGDADHRPR